MMSTNETEYGYNEDTFPNTTFSGENGINGSEECGVWDLEYHLISSTVQVRTILNITPSSI